MMTTYLKEMKVGLCPSYLVDEASDDSGSGTEEDDSSASSSGDGDSDSSIEIVGVTHNAEPVVIDHVPDGAIAVPSEAYPVRTSVKNDLASASKLQIPPRICMICLGDESNASDELIECDACKVVVHEGLAFFVLYFFRMP